MNPTEETEQTPRATSRPALRAVQPPEASLAGLRVAVLRGPHATVRPTNAQSAPLRVRPLEPKPLPMSANDARQSNGNVPPVDEPLQAYICCLCYEFMKYPVGCGQCASRFCNDCLEKVLGNVPHGEAHAKCPICRNKLAEIHPDQNLRDEMECQDPIKCRFEGCHQKLKLTQVSHHEEICPKTVLMCRFARYGCKWTGTREDLPSHEQQGCALAPIAKVVNDYRQLKADFVHTTVRLQAQIQLLEQQLNNSMMYIHRSRNINNPVDCITFTTMLLCTPRHFLSCTKLWSCVFESPNKRACLWNNLALLPTNIVALKIMFTGYSYQVEHLSLTQPKSLPDDFYPTSVLSVLVGCVALLNAVALAVDSGSSQTWRTYRLPHWNHEEPWVLHLASISMVIIYTGLIELYGRDVKAGYLWLCVCLATLFFPSFVVAMPTPAACSRNNQLSRTMLHESVTGRLFQPIFRGLVHGNLIGWLDDSMLFIDSLALKQILEWSPRSKADHFSDNLMQRIPYSVFVLYVGARCSGLYLAHLAGDNVALSLLLLALAQMYLFGMEYVGKHIPVTAGRMGLALIRRTICDAPSQDATSPLGVLVVSLWLILIGFIITT